MRPAKGITICVLAAAFTLGAGCAATKPNVAYAQETPSKNTPYGTIDNFLKLYDSKGDNLDVWDINQAKNYILLMQSSHDDIAKKLTKESSKHLETEIKKTLSTAFDNYGSAYTTIYKESLNKEDFEKAKVNYIKSTEINPNNVVAYNNLAYLCVRIGKNYDEGLRYLNEGIKNNPNSTSLIDKKQKYLKEKENIK